jgi:hypothetical protein
VDSGASVDLSEATKLKEVAFRSDELYTQWIAMALGTITPEHRELKQISIYNRFRQAIVDHTADVRQLGGEVTYGEWTDLDRILVRLWESHSVRTRVYSVGVEDGEVCEFIRGLLPETAERGAVELVEYADSRWNRYV